MLQARTRVLWMKWILMHRLFLSFIEWLLAYYIFKNNVMQKSVCDRKWFARQQTLPCSMLCTESVHSVSFLSCSEAFNDIFVCNGKKDEKNFIWLIKWDPFPFQQLGWSTWRKNGKIKMRIFAHCFMLFLCSDTFAYVATRAIIVLK